MPGQAASPILLGTSFIVLVVGTTRVGYLLRPSSLVAGASGDLGFNPGSELRAVLRRNGDRLLAPFLAFIRQEYRQIYELNGFVVLEKMRI